MGRVYHERIWETVKCHSKVCPDTVLPHVSDILAVPVPETHFEKAEKASAKPGQKRSRKLTSQKMNRTPWLEQ